MQLYAARYKAIASASNTVPPGAGPHASLVTVPLTSSATAPHPRRSPVFDPSVYTSIGFAVPSVASKAWCWEAACPLVSLTRAAGGLRVSLSLVFTSSVKGAVEKASSRCCRLVFWVPGLPFGGSLARSGCRWSSSLSLRLHRDASPWRCTFMGGTAFPCAGPPPGRAGERGNRVWRPGRRVCLRPLPRRFVLCRCRVLRSHSAGSDLSTTCLPRKEPPEGRPS